MCVLSKTLTSNPLWMSSRRHSTCPPSAAEWMGSWPESRIAFFVVMGMRVLRALERERGRQTGRESGAKPVKNKC